LHHVPKSIHAESRNSILVLYLYFLDTFRSLAYLRGLASRRIALHRMAPCGIPIHSFRSHLLFASSVETLPPPAVAGATALRVASSANSRPSLPATVDCHFNVGAHCNVLRCIALRCTSVVRVLYECCGTLCFCNLGSCCVRIRKPARAVSAQAPNNTLRSLRRLQMMIARFACVRVVCSCSWRMLEARCSMSTYSRVSAPWWLWCIVSCRIAVFYHIITCFRPLYNFRAHL